MKNRTANWVETIKLFAVGTAGMMPNGSCRADGNGKFYLDLLFEITCTLKGHPEVCQDTSAVCVRFTRLALSMAEQDLLIINPKLKAPTTKGLPNGVFYSYLFTNWKYQGIVHLLPSLPAWRSGHLARRIIFEMQGQPTDDLIILQELQRPPPWMGWPQG